MNSQSCTQALSLITGYSAIIHFNKFMENLKVNSKIDAQIQDIQENSNLKIIFYRKLFKCVRGELTQADFIKSKDVSKYYLNRIFTDIESMQNRLQMPSKLSDTEKVKKLLKIYPLESREAARFIKNVEDKKITNKEENDFLSASHIEACTKINELANTKLNLLNDVMQTTKAVICALPLVYCFTFKILS